MCKPLSADQVLYFLFTLLSLAFLSLLFASLFLVNPGATEAAGYPHHVALRALTFEGCFNAELQLGQRLGAASGGVRGAIPKGVDRPGPNLDQGSIGPSRPSRNTLQVQPDCMKGLLFPHAIALTGTNPLRFSPPALPGILAFAPCLHNGTAESLDEVLDNPAHLAASPLLTIPAKRKQLAPAIDR